jgi:hypothetical protein
VGKVANVIWGEGWDAKYILENSTNLMSFVEVIHDMYKVNLRA